MAMPTASGRDCAIAPRAQPPTFSGSGRNGPLGVYVADVSEDSYEHVDCRKETLPLRNRSPLLNLKGHMASVLQ